MTQEGASTMRRTALAAVTAQSDRLANYPSCVVCGSSKLSESGGPGAHGHGVRRARAPLTRVLSQPVAGYASLRGEGSGVRRVRHAGPGSAPFDARGRSKLRRGPLPSDVDGTCLSRVRGGLREEDAGARPLGRARSAGARGRKLRWRFSGRGPAAGLAGRGVDVGDCVARFARSKGLDVHTGHLEERCFPSRRFDAVFIWSCFDQLLSPGSSSTRSTGSSTITAGC